MKRPIAPLLALLLVGGTAAAQAPERARLKDHVVRLASPEFEGRRGAGGEKTAAYLVERFRKLGLAPAFGDDYTQTVPGRANAPATSLLAQTGRNVAAVLRGSDPNLRDDWVIVSAHYDHLGTDGQTVYPGADDNASGVAMMLEVARSFAEGVNRPRRSLMFVGFDLEEIGLFGSRYFAEHPPVPLDRISLFITADMIGRSLGGVCEPFVFVMGTEHAPTLRPWVASASESGPLKVGLIGSDLLLLDRSDYGPFRARKVPYLFFSTGENPRYHTPADTAETLDYAKVEAVSRVVHGVTRRAADAHAHEAPRWVDASHPTLDEAMTIREVVVNLLEHRETLNIGAAQVFVMRNCLRNLDAIAGRGEITPDERTALIRVARLILATIL
jgi:hypothetical protein